ncbi:pq loop repeat family protein [Stylonychia lemnae]|uniref:Pq loop repeat family protein n=1 Tax=Stylonychia lemnae TaxID=5949 RepID=A0A077ZR04_STYLE|nr:pq loop repeat family protein [Stylonychia lemnae]|eukprot:CDW72338.1 pq loop repeat family protein [Stylonychia lemnae]
MTDSHTWDIVSITIGWIYFFAWSFSFYPQIIINYRRKSVDGFSIEFALLNPQGFFFYSFYSIAGFIYTSPVTGTRGEKQQKLSWWPIALLIGEWIFVMTIFIVEVTGTKVNDNISTLRVAGYCKALITFVYLNYVRKSTDGWSIENIVLDLTGGTLSLLQQIIDTVARGQPFFGTDSFNIVKFMLSIMSIFFDCIFLFQHYVLYPHAKQPKNGQKPQNMIEENDQLINHSDNNTKQNKTQDEDYIK